MRRVKPVRNAAVIVRVYPEKRDILRFNVGLHGMSMSDCIRQTCPGIRLRKTPEEKRRLKELARIGANINQLARWANTCKRAAEAVEVLTALADIERRITEFVSCASTEDEPEAGPC
ncbi:MobC family plasmid mobilization relaxosome protein [Desulfovibrio sp. ZJ369]|uniref:MobC family plasmid mobilization relaxosome protein n=1 Tax=Desulfovibrio sp. ZJ369 TaxID=2709793 RepID=UPI0013EC9A1F|nr:MobC family plasmid mobilization relaxosome protein [Desulfovibrio sp. ZJ369]